jgi:site-specific recombinase XerD
MGEFCHYFYSEPIENPLHRIHNQWVITIHYLNQFETWLKQEGKGALTIDEYFRSVRLFEKWYTETNDADFIPKDITTLDVQDWKQHMQTHDKLKPATINKRISSLKVYWSFLIDAGLAPVDITKKVKTKRSSQVNDHVHVKSGSADQRSERLGSDGGG